MEHYYVIQENLFLLNNYVPHVYSKSWGNPTQGLDKSKLTSIQDTHIACLVVCQFFSITLRKEKLKRRVNKLTSSYE